MKELLELQYQDIKSAREVLLNYCAGMSPGDLFKPVPEFNGSTIMKLLVHNANVYLHWLEYFDKEFSGDYFNEGEIKTIGDLQAIYLRANKVVSEFINRHQGNYLQAFTKPTRTSNIMVPTNPLQLFTHVITHEFHHKGQILSMGRLLGYMPVDADVIRT